MRLRINILLVACMLSLTAYAQTFHMKVAYYHPVKAECSGNPLITADGSKVNLHKLKQGKIRWCAVPRELLCYFPKDKPKRIWIEGYGIYEVHDVTSKRIKNTVDIMVHPANKNPISCKRVKIKIIYD